MSKQASATTKSGTASRPDPAADLSASWRMMVGIALVWAGLAALIHAQGTIVIAAGFAAFAGGLALILDGLKRSIVRELTRAARPAQP